MTEPSNRRPWHRPTLTERVVTDREALDLLSAWLCRPSADSTRGSAADFIELAADLIRRTGRPIDPLPEPDDI